MYRQLVSVLVPLVCLNLALAVYSTTDVYHTLGEVVIQPTVTVSGDIDYRLNLLLRPEKRIPPLHNDSLLVDLVIRPVGSGVSIYSASGTTNDDGLVEFGPIPYSLVTSQYHDILIKGLSHLRRLYPNLDFYQGAGLTFDLRDPVLFAGDSHPTADNYVNSLDVSYEILNLYTSDLRADLNRDTIVNSLEFPTMISHLYQTGDE